MKRLDRHPDSASYLTRVFLLLLLLALVAAGVTAWLAFFTDMCQVKEVKVHGNEHLTVEYIRDRSGVDLHKNLITLPVGRLDENLENDAWVKEAKIGRRLLHTVTIEVTEREPVAVVDFSGAGFLVDGEAHVITETAPGEFGELPRVHGGDASVPTVDSKISNKKIRECVDVMGAMPPSLRATLGLANPFDGRGYVFISRSGYHIIYGSATNCPRKDEILEAVVSEITSNNRQVAYIDLTVPDCPVIKPI